MDLIDRQAAIDALETVGYDFSESELSEVELEEVCGAVSDVRQDMMDRIKQLPPANTSEIPNSSDTISRAKAIDGKICIQRSNGVEIYDDYVVPVEYLKQLPPAQPEPSQVAKDIARIVENGQDMRVIEERPHWIPVTERLPEEYCECLVTYRTVDMQEFMDILEYEPSYEFDYEKGRFKGEWLFATNDERFTDGEVIAWMPLPEAYKESEVAT